MSKAYGSFVQAASVIVLVATPVLFCFLWLDQDTTVPVADAGNHYHIAVWIFKQFQSGLLEGLMTLSAPGGKPIVFAAYALPVFSMVGLDPVIASKTFSFLVYVMMLGGFYYAITFFVKPHQGAMLTALYGSLPYVFNLSVQFMPETSWQMWFWLFLGSLVRSDFLKVGHYSFLAGLTLGLCILCRPVESVVVFSLPLFAYFLYVGWMSKSRAYCIGIMSAVFTTGLLVMAAFAFNHYQKVGVGFGCFLLVIFLSLACLVYLRVKPERDSLGVARISPLFIFLLPLFSVCFLWFLFNGEALFRWAFSNSFGAEAKVNDQVFLGKNVFGILLDVMASYGLIAFTVLSVLAVTKAIVQHQKKQLLLVVMMLVSVLGPMLMGYSMTGTSDFRRILVGMLFAFFALGIFVFWQARRKFSYCAFSLLLGVACLQHISLGVAVFSNTNLAQLIHRHVDEFNQAVNLAYSSPVQQSAVNTEVLQELNSGIIPPNSKLAVFSLSYFSPRDMAIEVDSLRYSALIENMNMKFEPMWGYIDYEPMNAVINRLVKRGYDYVLIQASKNPLIGTEYEERLRSHTFFVEDFVNALHQHGPHGIKGLRLVRKIPIESHEIFLYKPLSDKESIYLGTDNENPSFDLGRLLDGEAVGSSFWEMPHSIDTKLYFAFDESKTIRGLRLISGSELPERMPRSIKVLSSTDGLGWSTQTLDVHDRWHKNETRTLPLHKAVTAQYLQLHLPEGRSISRIYEIEFVSDQKIGENFNPVVVNGSFVEFKEFLRRAEAQGV